ncbi:unnamed protein product [Chondrus crispus]|uniref:Uncharacterized protein n=1 Tax=Chondrus crispus TaxID=2769 RepID=R7QJM7_CHOCR|nr:unnamed protein product [Chondrus crispus]CDF37610.1 unnamed protein product [Chondrus crispus]|eukprot:XP_005717481.1 unnamed protein product [Chondrus crispus]
MIAGALGRSQRESIYGGENKEMPNWGSVNVEHKNSRTRNLISPPR